MRRTIWMAAASLGIGAYICLGSEGGNAVFLEPGVEMKEVAASTIGSFRTTPVFENDRVYIRTRDAMVCIRP